MVAVGGLFRNIQEVRRGPCKGYLPVSIMLIFVRSYLSAYDARIQKYFHVMERLGLPYAFIGWRRDEKPYQPRPYEILYEGRGKLGARWRNALSIIGWNAFVFAALVKRRGQVSAVHAVDLDTALVSYLYCRLFGKAFIFDVYDKYSAVRNVTGFPGHAMDTIERYLMRHARLTLLAGEDRLEQMQLAPGLENCLVLENVPLIATPATALPKFDGKWRIGYFGVLEPVHRGLEDLMRVAGTRDDVELHLAGYGGLETMAAELAVIHENIHYHGPMGSDTGLKLMAQMHVTAGLYYLSVPNHAYAAPNKYFEHLMLGRGMLTTAGTSPGRKVETCSTGWALAEGKEALHTWLSQLTWKEVENAGKAARELWDRKYQHYFEDHYVSLYGRQIADMLKTSNHD